MNCPHCGEVIERELLIQVTPTERGGIHVEVSDTFEDPTLERKVARATGKLLVEIGRELGTPLKLGKVKMTCRPRRRHDIGHDKREVRP